MELNIDKLDRHLIQDMPDSVQQKYLRQKGNTSGVSSIIHTGFVAQDVEEIVPEVVHTDDGKKVLNNFVFGVCGSQTGAFGGGDR